MLEDLAKLHQVHVINVEFVKSLEITLHVIRKLLIDQFNDFIVFELLRCSTMWREEHKIIINLTPMREVLANGHQTVKTDLLQVAFLCLKSILGENVLRDRVNAHFVMRMPHLPMEERLADSSYVGLGGGARRMLSNTNGTSSTKTWWLLALTWTSKPDGTSDGLHINILEFIAMIINMWFVFVFIQCRGPCQGGYVVSLQADNTSALSWLRYASHSHQPIMWELSHFALGLTLASPIPPKLVGIHIKGNLNLGADTLSWPKEYPTWACTTK